MKNRKNGFTLIELLVSMFILMVGVLAFLSLQISSIKARSLSKNITSAVFVAEAKMADLLSMDFDAIDNGTDNITINNVNYLRNWAISLYSESLKGITINVKWNQNQKNHTFSLLCIKKKQ